MGVGSGGPCWRQSAGDTQYPTFAPQHKAPPEDGMIIAFCANVEDLIMNWRHVGAQNSHVPLEHPWDTRAPYSGTIDTKWRKLVNESLC